jgi:hypothetical protein
MTAVDELGYVPLSQTGTDAASGIGFLNRRSEGRIFLALCRVHDQLVLDVPEQSCGVCLSTLTIGVSTP